MKRTHLWLLATVAAAVVLGGCTSSTTVQDDPNQTASGEASGGGQARATPGLEAPLALAGLGAAAALALFLRRRA